MNFQTFLLTKTVVHAYRGAQPLFHALLNNFGVKTLSETPCSPPLKQPGYGARHAAARTTIAATLTISLNVTQAEAIRPAIRSGVALLMGVEDRYVTEDRLRHLVGAVCDKKRERRYPGEE